MILKIGAPGVARLDVVVRRETVKHAMSGYPRFTWINCLRGMIIYGCGDTLAALILGEFNVGRLLGMALVGGIVYGWEVPNWFHWIDRNVRVTGWRLPLARTACAMAYFNPLWIGRHLAFILIFSGSWQQIGWDLVRIGAWSFVANIPVAFLANWLIQNRITLRWRFVASALFSASMAVYYALSVRIF